MPAATLRPAALLALLLVPTACAVRPATVPLEDGTTAYDIRCSPRTLACTTQAASVCGDDGYVVLDQDPFLLPSPSDQQGVMRIQCGTEYEELHRPFTLAAAPPVAVDRQLVCRRAWDSVADTARLWSAERGLPERASPPRPEDFALACVALPERAQLCLNAVYREHHESLCAETLHALSGRDRKALDDLLLATTEGI